MSKTSGRGGGRDANFTFKKKLMMCVGWPVITVAGLYIILYIFEALNPIKPKHSLDDDLMFLAILYAVLSGFFVAVLLLTEFAATPAGRRFEAFASKYVVPIIISFCNALLIYIFILIYRHGNMPIIH